MNNDFKIESIQIKNIKNVCNGKVDFIDNEGFINLLGIYGQNGSGKTTLITAIEFCKLLISGQVVNEEIFDLDSLLRFGISSSIEITFIFGSWTFIYSVTVAKRKVERYESEIKTTETGFSIVSESLKYKENKPGSRMKIFMAYDEMKALTFSLKPVTKFPLNTKNITLVSTAIRSFENKVSSIIFNDLLKELIHSAYMDEEIFNKFLDFKKKVQRDIFVFTNQSNGLINLNSGSPLPLYFYYKGNGQVASGVFPLPTNKSTKIPDHALDVFKNIILQINFVLPQLVPNLEIGIRELSHELDKNGDKLTEIEVISKRKDIEIPFRAESDGNKKIVSILSSLIHAYSSSEAIVLIDEFDSGIFEYLLGEILVSLNDVMKGQIIFTSHNLRALEVLKVRNVVFTTTDENEVYKRFNSIKETNNLRDIYLREVQLGTENQLYNKTNVFKIQKAFRTAKKSIEEQKEE